MALFSMPYGIVKWPASSQDSNYGFEVGAQKTRCDHRFRRRVAVSAQPVRVRATDHFRQPLAAAIKIDRCGFTGIAGEDADGGIIRWERIANAKHRIGHFAPTELLIEIDVCRVGDSPPA